MARRIYTRKDAKKLDELLMKVKPPPFYEPLGPSAEELASSFDRQMDDMKENIEALHNYIDSLADKHGIAHTTEEE